MLEKSKGRLQTSAESLRDFVLTIVYSACKIRPREGPDNSSGDRLKLSYHA